MCVASENLLLDSRSGEVVTAPRYFKNQSLIEYKQFPNMTPRMPRQAAFHRKAIAKSLKPSTSTGAALVVRTMRTSSLVYLIERRFAPGLSLSQGVGNVPHLLITPLLPLELTSRRLAHSRLGESRLDFARWAGLDWTDRGKQLRERVKALSGSAGSAALRRSEPSIRNPFRPHYHWGAVRPTPRWSSWRRDKWRSTINSFLKNPESEVCQVLL